MSKYPGLFITFEGCEGCGKSTVMKMIFEFFSNLGYPVISTREPGGISISEQIRNVILDVNNTEMDPMTEALLYAAARRQHLVEKVIPYLEQGYIVLCDRFIDSSLAYQGYARGLGIENIYNINMQATDGLLPDMTILLDIEFPEIGLRRIASNNREQNRLDKEKLEFHKKVYEGYQEITIDEKNILTNRIMRVNANQPINDVYADTANLIISKAEDFYLNTSYKNWKKQWVAKQNAGDKQ